jgi:hypothetical protein
VGKISENNLKGGIIYFGSWFLRYQSIMAGRHGRAEQFTPQRPGRREKRKNPGQDITPKQAHPQ